MCHTWRDSLARAGCRQCITQCWLVAVPVVTEVSLVVTEVSLVVTEVSLVVSSLPLDLALLGARVSWWRLRQ